MFREHGNRKVGPTTVAEKVQEFVRQLYLLEALAALAGILIEAKEKQRVVVVMMVDNIGAVWTSVKEFSEVKQFIH